jgi:hypothetical protein
VTGNARPLVSFANPSLGYTHPKRLSPTFAIYHVNDNRGEHRCMPDDRDRRLLKALFMPDERAIGVPGDIGVSVEDISPMSRPLHLGMHESPQLSNICVGKRHCPLLSRRDDFFLICVHRPSVGILRVCSGTLAQPTEPTLEGIAEVNGARTVDHDSDPRTSSADDAHDGARRYSRR